MTTPGMDADLSQLLSASTTEPDALQLLDANLAALGPPQANAAAAIRSAPLPPQLEKTTGRDGTPTYCLRDAANNTVQWLGPTTTPLVTADALLSKFDAGMGNVLLPFVGDGSMASALLAKLRPHQALFVVEPEAWRAKAALMLYDCTDAARAGRLVLSVGHDAWDQLRGFLNECRGYLPPERTLALPWIDAAQMRTIQAELQALQTPSVAQPDNAAAAKTPSSSTITRVVILSNSLAPEAHYLARQLEAEANNDAACDAFCSVPDRPDCLHPQFVQAQVNALQPTHVLLVDCCPDDVSVVLPDVAAHIVIAHGSHIPASLLEKLPSNGRLWVRSNAQRTAALSAEIDPDRVATYIPTATVAANPAPITIERVFVAGLPHIPEAEHVGLNLGSHRALWRACATIIGERINTYTDDHADQVLRDAERTLNTQLQSDDVRAGIVERVRQYLGPAVIAVRIREALAKLDIEVTVLPYTTFLRDTPDAPVVWVNTSRIIHPAVVRLAAAGVPVALRSITSSAPEPDDGLLQKLPSFTSIAYLQSLIDNWQRDETAMHEAAKAVMANMQRDSILTRITQSIG